MKEKIFKVKVIDGIRALKRFLDDECIVYDYVFNADKVHEGPDYIVPGGIPVIFIERAGMTGYVINIDTLDEDFNRVPGYAIKFGTTINEVQRTQTLLNQLLVQHKAERDKESEDKQ